MAFLFYDTPNLAPSPHFRVGGTADVGNYWDSWNPPVLSCLTEFQGLHGLRGIDYWLSLSQIVLPLYNVDVQSSWLLRRAGVVPMVPTGPPHWWLFNHGRHSLVTPSPVDLHSSLHIHSPWWGSTHNRTHGSRAQASSPHGNHHICFTGYGALPRALVCGGYGGQYLLCQKWKLRKFQNFY